MHPLIAPSLLSADFSKLGAEVVKLEEAGADRIHLDIMDGHFVDNITFGPSVIKHIRPFTSLPFETHLMISPYERYLDDFINAGSDIILIHCEAEGNISKSLIHIRNTGKKSGIVINPETDIDKISPFLDLCDQVLVMTVNPGFGGQSFMEDQVEKIAKVKQMIGNRNIHIEVDGGIHKTTAKVCFEAGADILVAGSAVFKTSDYESNIKVLRSCV